MEPRSPELKAELGARLRRIEGQVRGVERMIDEGRDCREVLQQMAAVRSAMRQASLVLTRAYLSSYLREPQPEEAEVVLDRVIATLGQLE